MGKYLEAEKILASLLGWTFIPDRFDTEREINADGEWQAHPRWTRNSAAAYALMVEHGCYPWESTQEPMEGWICVGGNGYAKIGDHPDKDTAVRYAIVKAVIAKLEAERPT